MNNFEKLSAIQGPELPVEQERSPERPFFEEERKLLGEAGKKIDNAPAEKLKKPGFRALAAFLTFLAGSTAFADRALAEHDTTRTVADKNAIEKNIGTIDLELRNTYRMEDPPFDTGRIARELLPRESSLEKNFEFIEVDRFRDPAGTRGPGEFYGNLSNNEVFDASQAYIPAIMHSRTYSEFLGHVQDSRLGNQEKMVFLQELGNHLVLAYDSDMVTRNEHITISEEDMFQALRSNILQEDTRAGICGNIHTFMLTVAKELGFKDVWLNNGIVGYDSPNGHVWMGMIAQGPDGKDQIVYFDYGRLITTGTLDPANARGIMERRHKQISLFNSYVGAKGSVLAPVESLAQRTMRRAGGLEGSDSILQKNLSEGEITQSRGLELTLDRELMELTISNDTVGLAYVRYEDNNNPYHALQGLDGIRAALHLGNKNVGIEFDTTVLHLAIKDLEGGAMKQTEIINRLAFNTLSGAVLTAGEYGKFVATFGTSVEAAARYLLHKPNAKKDSLGYIEGSTGIRIALLNPAETREVYIGALAKIRPQPSDFEEQNMIMKAALKQFTVGSVVEVQRGVLMNAEQELAEVEYGTRSATRLGVRVGDIMARVSHENTSSAVPSAVPHARRTSFEVSKNFPQGELVFYGAKTDTQYASVKDTAKQFGVTMRVVLW